MEWQTDPRTDGGLEGCLFFFFWRGDFLVYIVLREVQKLTVNLPEHWVSKKNWKTSWKSSKFENLDSSNFTRSFIYLCLYSWQALVCSAGWSTQLRSVGDVFGRFWEGSNDLPTLMVTLKRCFREGWEMCKLPGKNQIYSHVSLIHSCAWNTW